MNFKELGEKIGLEEDEYRELTELFIETGMADYDQLKTAWDAGDADEVSRRAHTLSGAAGNLGIMNLHQVAKQIEIAAKANQLEDLSTDVDALKGLFVEIAAAVRR